MCEHYSKYVVYALAIDNDYRYIGCHCAESLNYLTEGTILSNSGNPLNFKVRKHEISRDEYNRRVELIKVIPCESKEEALALEERIINIAQQNLGSLCLNQSSGNRNGQLGITHSEATRQKMSDSQKKSPVQQYSKDGELLGTFPSVREAERQTGIPNSNIQKCCKGKYQSAGGFQWRYL